MFEDTWNIIEGTLNIKLSYSLYILHELSLLK